MHGEQDLLGRICGDLFRESNSVNEILVDEPDTPELLAVLRRHSAFLLALEVQHGERVRGRRAHRVRPGAHGSGRRGDEAVRYNVRKHSFHLSVRGIEAVECVVKIGEDSAVLREVEELVGVRLELLKAHVHVDEGGLLHESPLGSVFHGGDARAAFICPAVHVADDGKVDVALVRDPLDSVDKVVVVLALVRHVARTA